MRSDSEDDSNDVMMMTMKRIPTKKKRGRMMRMNQIDFAWSYYAIFKILVLF